jgi:hypothetical protein
MKGTLLYFLFGVKLFFLQGLSFVGLDCIGLNVFDPILHNMKGGKKDSKNCLNGV